MQSTVVTYVTKSQRQNGYASGERYDRDTSQQCLHPGDPRSPRESVKHDPAVGHHHEHLRVREMGQKYETLDEINPRVRSQRGTWTCGRVCFECVEVMPDAQANRGEPTLSMLRKPTPFPRWVPSLGGASSGHVTMRVHIMDYLQTVVRLARDHVGFSVVFA